MPEKIDEPISIPTGDRLMRQRAAESATVRHQAVDDDGDTDSRNAGRGR
jgi:hypothetical protein